MKFIDHTEILNYLIERYNFKTYLEIGVQHRVNFNKIKASFKYGVDPGVFDDVQVACMTSDEYFATRQDNSRYDIIFIDGLHTSEQVEKDFFNAMKILSPNGMIVMHDTVPLNKDNTLIPRVTKQWNGDVYKFGAKLNSLPLVDFKTYNLDHGVTVAWRAFNPNRTDQYNKIDWEEFEMNKGQIMRFSNNLPGEDRAPHIVFRDDDVFDPKHGNEKFIAAQELFDKYGLRHTAAVITEHIEGNKELVTYIREHNIDVQFHCKQHFDYTTLTREELQEQFKTGTNTILNYFGKLPTVFYPPWNRSNELVEEVAASFGLSVHNAKTSLENYVKHRGRVSQSVINFHYWSPEEMASLEQALKVCAEQL